MRKMILLSFLVLLIPAIVCGQNKIDAPVWNIGDKWNLTGDVTVLVVNADESSYVVKYLTSGGESVLICEKPSLNRIYSMDKKRRIKYEGRNRRLFNFPLDIGKSWKDKFVVKPAALADQEKTYLETFTVLGWEDVEVQAGKIKALKLEYKQEMVEQPTGRPKEGKVWYWYSPDVKYMVKCQYEKTDYWDALYDWELTSFQLKK
jgi:hypothetical protein